MACKMNFQQSLYQRCSNKPLFFPLPDGIFNVLSEMETLSLSSSAITAFGHHHRAYSIFMWDEDGIHVYLPNIRYIPSRISDTL